MRVLSIHRIVLSAALSAAGLSAPHAVLADNQATSAGGAYTGGSQTRSGNTTSSDANTQSPRATTSPSTEKDANTTATSAGQTGTDMATNPASSMKPADQQLSQRVEQAIESDQALSPVSDSVHVVARDGKVLLMGTVPSQGEKAKVEQHARRIAGKNNVKNQLEVTSLQ